MAFPFFHLAFRQYLFLYERCSTKPVSIKNPALMEEIVIMFSIRSDGSLYITAICLHRIVCNSLCTLVNRGMSQISINFSKPCCVRGVLLLYNSFATHTWISYKVKNYRDIVYPKTMKKEDKLAKDKLDRKVRHPTASFSTKSIIMNLIIAFFLYLLRRTIEAGGKSAITKYSKFIK